MIEIVHAVAAETRREIPLRVHAGAGIRRTRKRNVRADVKARKERRHSVLADVDAEIPPTVRTRCRRFRARRWGMILLGCREPARSVREDADAKIVRRNKMAVEFVGFCGAFSARPAVVTVGNEVNAHGEAHGVFPCFAK